MDTLGSSHGCLSLGLLKKCCGPDFVVLPTETALAAALGMCFIDQALGRLTIINPLLLLEKQLKIKHLPIGDCSITVCVRLI